MINRRSLVAAFALFLASASSLATACASDDAGPDDDALDDGGGASGGGATDAQAAASKDASVSGGLDGRVADASTGARDAGPPRSQDAARDAQGASDAARDAQTGAPLGGASSGCGKAVSDPAGKFTMHTLRVGDRDRTYHVYIPEGYQATRRYPAIFRYHGSGGDGLSGGLDVQYAAPKDVIIVAPDGLAGSGGQRSWSPNQAELDLFDALVKAAGESYCLDLGRLFAFGFSAGAGLSEMLACARGNTLRGIGAIAGYDWGRGRTCEGQVAAWLVHDANDQPAPIAGGRAARDRLLQQNGCSMDTEPAGPTCVRYRGCAEGHPVVWCETQGMGHNIRGDYGPGEVWKFFSGLP